MIAIRPYYAEYRDEFERLNLLWLEQHGLLEPLDQEYLRNPEAMILEVGGEVFFAIEHDMVIGTCAVIPVDETRVELAKLVVSPEARGRGVARMLAAAVFAFARERGATIVELTSSTKLTAALALYESLGFRHDALPADVRYQTADVYMTLDLTTVPA